MQFFECNYLPAVGGLDHPFFLVLNNKAITTREYINNQSHFQYGYKLHQFHRN